MIRRCSLGLLALSMALLSAAEDTPLRSGQQVGDKLPG